MTTNVFRVCWLRCAPPLLGVILLAIMGCAGSATDNLVLVPVTGKVTVGGKALHTGSVSFRPDKARGNTSTVESHGDIAEDGAYTLFTNKKPGAPVGKYIVLVTASEDIDPRNPSATPKELVDRKYADPDRPLLQVEVEAGPKAGQYDLSLSK